MKDRNMDKYEKLSQNQNMNQQYNLRQKPPSNQYYYQNPSGEMKEDSNYQQEGEGYGNYNDWEIKGKSRTEYKAQYNREDNGITGGNGKRVLARRQRGHPEEMKGRQSQRRRF